MTVSTEQASSCCDKSQGLAALEDVIAHLEANANPTKHTIQADLKTCLHGTLSESISSSLNVPPTDNSAVDGYALRSQDIESSNQLTISQRIPAGLAPTALVPGTAARIFTGASIPEGADCVVMQEDCAANGNEVVINTQANPGQNIRPMGQDIMSGDTVLHTGDILTPQAMGLAASIGIGKPNVYAPLKVAILSTGDELVEPGEQAPSGKIYNSNRYMLHGLLSSFQMEIIDLGVIQDTLDETIEALKNASQKADVIITTGGASVGEEDHIQSAIKTLGAVDLWRVAIKPGKPFMFGNVNKIPVLGLPGNPGAVLVTFLLLARPFLLRMQGRKNTEAAPFYLPLGFDIKKSGKRREFLRVRRASTGELQRHPNQSSGMLSSATWAEGLAVIQENTAPQKGELVPFLPFEQLLT